MQFIDLLLLPLHLSFHLPFYLHPFLDLLSLLGLNFAISFDLGGTAPPLGAGLQQIEAISLAHYNGQNHESKYECIKDEYGLTADGLALLIDLADLRIHLDIHAGFFSYLLMASIHPLLDPISKLAAYGGH